MFNADPSEMRKKSVSCSQKNQHICIKAYNSLSASIKSIHQPRLAFASSKKKKEDVGKSVIFKHLLRTHKAALACTDILW